MSDKTKAFSGKAGTVRHGSGSGTVLYEVIGWTFEPSNNNPAVCSNYTGGYKSRASGVKDSKGTVTVKIPTDGKIPYEPGDFADLVLDADGAGTNKITVPAIIDSVPIECKIDEGELVGYTFNFSGAAAWTGAGIFAKT